MARRVLVMGFGFILAVSCGALFLPIAALADSTVREAGFEAVIGSFFAMLDETARDGDPAAGFHALGLVFWAILIAVCVAPLAFAALVGEIAGARSWIWYVGASGILAAASPWIARGARAQASAHPPSQMEIRVLGLFFLTGALTGFLYWLAAGRGSRPAQ
ncbi:hypothetical protein [Methylocystis bryophila]|uniref:Uncharacterized protein n=1 Tax=Methylocystis bryophila TaxID=655015 RepID=A0A1W6MWK4_9HYPH|nr:hypothetical protein [Methylocystis bryophila]ARN81916.1 hypothetical protein B1812_13410 [Methylocystis bryophila]BDV38003.1 hypothetical protein DSM21852_12560 [Methylocystis bryophila]